MCVYQFIKTIGVFLLFVTSTVLFANELTLLESEQLALDSDFITREFNTRSASLSERVIADGQLPDPKIKLGIMYMPVDSFDRSQEPMTQLQVGIQQSFPRGRTLHYKRLRRRDPPGDLGSRKVGRSARNSGTMPRARICRVLPSTTSGGSS